MYKYYLDGGIKLKRFYAEQDPEPWNPRTDIDGNIGHLYIWWGNYDLGDKKEDSYRTTPSGMMIDLIEDKLSAKDIIQYAVKGESADGLKLEKTQKGWHFTTPRHASDWYYADMSEENLDEMVYEMLDDHCTYGDLCSLLEKTDVVLMPVYVYEHGGITISTGSGYPYCDRFDGGQGGFIWTDKETVEKERLIKEGQDWKEIAAENLRSEVKMYDMYLQNECYIYYEDTWNEKTGTWDEKTESFGGYYSEKIGDDLLKDIARECMTEKEYATISDDPKAYGREDTRWVEFPIVWECSGTGRMRLPNDVSDDPEEVMKYILSHWDNFNIPEGEYISDSDKFSGEKEDIKIVYA